jgi:DNA-binding response OmpR family regulator
VIPPLKIVGASAFTDDFKVDCLNAGMHDFITKPLNIDMIKRVFMGMNFKAKKIVKPKEVRKVNSDINMDYNLVRDQDEEEITS